MKSNALVTKSAGGTDYRDLFPLFGTYPGLAYLDSASTAQKPQPVIDALLDFYTQSNSNIHRGLYALSLKASELYEQSRETVARFINAGSEEIVFVRGTTEAVSLVARAFLQPRLRPGDEILLTRMEHHSNILPWQLAAQAAGAQLRYIELGPDGSLLPIEDYLTEKTRLVSVTHVSNVLGTINPIAQIASVLRPRNIPLVVDGAQAVCHLPIDVQELGCDFYAFSGHKAYGPTGIGVLYGRQELLQAMPPYEAGGGMIEFVQDQDSTYLDSPQRFEAGTPHIAGAVALAAALKFVSELGLLQIQAREHDLWAYAQLRLAQIPGIKIFGSKKCPSTVISFGFDDIHPHDISTVLDEFGVAVRAGHHCAQPLMRHLDVPATARISFGVYNTRADIDQLVKGLEGACKIFRR